MGGAADLHDQFDVRGPGGRDAADPGGRDICGDCGHNVYHQYPLHVDVAVPFAKGGVADDESGALGVGLWDYG